MKKIILVVILFTSNLIFCQEFSYGLVLKSSFYQVGNDNGTIVFTGKENGLSSALKMGIYGEYNFNDKIGVKTEFTYLKKKIFLQNTETPYILNHLSIAPNLKYDFGNEYRKGFYILFGPKISLLTSAKFENEDVKETFESFTLTPQLGFGSRVFKYIDLEAKLEYDVLPFFNFENEYKSFFFGCNLGATIDLERIFSN